MSITQLKIKVNINYFVCTHLSQYLSILYVNQFIQESQFNAIILSNLIATNGMLNILLFQYFFMAQFLTQFMAQILLPLFFIFPPFLFFLIPFLLINPPTTPQKNFLS